MRALPFAAAFVLAAALKGPSVVEVSQTVVAVDTYGDIHSHFDAEREQSQAVSLAERRSSNEPERREAERQRAKHFLQVCRMEESTPGMTQEMMAERQGLCGREWDGRIPSIYSGIDNMPSIEIRMTDEQKAALEHVVADRLIVSDVVVKTSTKFGERMFNLVVHGGQQFHGKDKAGALLAAFTCSNHNTGFVGRDAALMEQVLTVDGSAREIWCLFYCLSKNQAWLDVILSQADEAFFQTALGDEAGTTAFAVVEARKVLVNRASTMAVDEKFTFGTPDYLFPTPSSWSQFAFGASLPRRLGGGVMWEGARAFKKTGCEETTLRSDDATIVPPLSQREIEAECAGEDQPCKLKWYPGAGCFTLSTNNLFHSRTVHNGYRRVAGPSGTTANALQFALTLGFSQKDLLAFRTAMHAWLIAADHHSFIEIMLTAQTWMEGETFQMQWGLSDDDEDPWADFQRIWPKGYQLKTSWGETFDGAGDFMAALPRVNASGSVVF